MTEQADQLPPVPEDISDMLKREQQEAPYGRDPATGQPRPKPGRKPGSKTRAKPTGPKAPPRRPAAKQTGPDYRAALEGFFQLPAGILLMLGQRNIAFRADAAAVLLHGPPIAAGFDQLAREQPAVAALLDRVLQVGPYGAVFMPLFALGLQFAANHKAIPLTVPGVVPPEQLIAQVVGMPETSAPDGAEVPEAEPQAA
jgi:hypothetical protein